ncbi:hypothetical protein JRQ81_015715 [Phrynocephalus forsythii]|uniref:HTH CENPB-type domain-containing protein n=1 Tax=Phrynocephalus forsythii TaxID=171643 RepID=A0A9Q1B1P0_9SAUR|nr:hypothetical protein JRQ81_015715 [Phrynocephalus forsythii]
MAPKNAVEAGKMMMKKILLEVRKEIIQKLKEGMQVIYIPREYGRNPSTIGTTLKNKDRITGQDVAEGVTRISKNQPLVLNKVEKLLLLWIHEKECDGDTVSEAMICTKAKALHADLITQQPGTSDKPEFKASRSCLDLPAAEDFAMEFLEVMNAEGLFWKRMLKRTIIMQGEISLPGHKPMKDCLNLLFCANTSGDLKIKPLLVYHSENPQAFKKHKVFGPSVKHYLVYKNLPIKALLMTDNAPAHPPGLEDDLLEEFTFIKLMDQQVISNFKKLYTRELFWCCFEMTDGSGISLQDCWRRHFDIVSCLQLIKIAWDGGELAEPEFWRNLWPDCVVAPASDASAPAGESAVLQEIVSLGRTMGLEVTVENISKLVEGQDIELTTEELVELQKETLVEQVSSEVEETKKETVSTCELKEVC